MNRKSLSFRIPERTPTTRKRNTELDILSYGKKRWKISTIFDNFRQFPTISDNFRQFSTIFNKFWNFREFLRNFTRFFLATPLRSNMSRCGSVEVISDVELTSAESTSSATRTLKRKRETRRQKTLSTIAFRSPMINIHDFDENSLDQVRIISN